MLEIKNRFVHWGTDKIAQGGGLFAPAILGVLRHLYLLSSDYDYRTWCLLGTRLSRKPRFTEFMIEVGGWNLSIPDSASFLSMYGEIFVRKIYGFHHAGGSPKILDLGANIGLSVLFFKRLYPRARITALEADPMIFGHLKRNIHGNGFTDVNLLNCAVWDRDEKLCFNSEGADGGCIKAGSGDRFTMVQGVDIRSLLEEGTFDLLKMDIEGAELQVIPACSGHLSRVKNIFVEYHSQEMEPQYLNIIVDTLTDAGFRLHIHGAMTSPHPFRQICGQNGFDMQLNIFGVRPC